MNRWSRVRKEVLEETSIEDTRGCHQDTLRRRVSRGETRLEALEREVHGLSRLLSALANALGYQLTYIPSTLDEWKYIPNPTNKGGCSRG